ncbi:MAG: efflux RND transporter periplasmic adaptor subunit [Paracoccaceae bacterium]
MRRSLMLLCVAVLPQFGGIASAETPALQPIRITEWKAVYGQVEARDRMPARARLGGTLVDLTVVEGDLVKAGQPIGRIEDEKLAFQISALAAQRGALTAQLTNAQSELTRGESLLKQGVTTAQGLDALRTQVDVFTGQIAALDAQADVITQQVKEGTVLAPADGRVLDAPVAKGGVVMPGEAVAVIGGGGTFLRISVPERHAPSLHQGDAIEISDGTSTRTGTLSRIYPLIQNGRVIADVELAGLPDTFVDARMLVWLPVGQRQALMVPVTAISSTAGLDFVSVAEVSGPVQRSVVPGEHQVLGGVEMVEILSGLQAGDHVLPGAAK